MDTGSKPVILFDGVCNYCNGMVNFVIRQDKKQQMHFATLQSDVAQDLLGYHGLPKDNFDSFVFIENNQAYLQSTAALKVMNRLPWYWKWTQIFWAVPKFIRDSVYNFIAKRRYKWFGKKTECMVPTPEMKAKFLK